MHRERVSENVYWFQSEVYAQVTAGVVAGPQWAVVIDTLALPDETLGMREFIEHELGVPVRYVINTHYHADHAWGNCFFPGATVIAHTRCRELLLERGVPSLETAARQNLAELRAAREKFKPDDFKTLEHSLVFQELWARIWREQMRAFFLRQIGRRQGWTDERKAQLKEVLTALSQRADELESTFGKGWFPHGPQRIRELIKDLQNEM